MSSHRLFSIVGDANVRRNMIGLNIASRATMKSAQVIDCVQMCNLEAALNKVRAESEVLIVACITEFLISGGDCGTLASSIDPALTSFSTLMHRFCAARQNLQVREFSSFYYALWVASQIKVKVGSESTSSIIYIKSCSTTGVQIW